MELRNGLVVDPGRWPEMPRPRIYVALDDVGPVYVGQTKGRLRRRLNGHLGSLSDPDSRLKSEQWTGLVTLAFSDLAVDDLDHLERSAAQWLLPWQHRRGRRHPQ